MSKFAPLFSAFLFLALAMLCKLKVVPLAENFALFGGWQSFAVLFSVGLPPGVCRWQDVRERFVGRMAKRIGGVSL